VRRLPALAIAGVAVVVVAGLGAARVTGQPPAFDAASIKLNKLGAARSGRLAPGRFEQTGVTLRDLIGMAYGRQEISGAPSWTDTDRFDVMATGDFTLAGFLPGSDGSPPVVYMMLRSLLTERFKLAIHVATEERPIYALVTARADKKLGERMHQSDVDCNAYLAAAARGVPPSAPPPGARPGPPCSLRGNTPGRMAGNSISMGQLASVLSSSGDRPVFDRTGLAGNFDVDLEWTPALSTQGPPAPGGASVPSAGDPPPLFTALEDQLGLKLEATRGPVEILVVDHVEHPTSD
jgi:uncharacterized protein (TIGR03435 family)